jgi:hypothetical protein
MGTSRLARRAICASSATRSRRNALAELIEREFGGFKPPPMFDD